MRKNLLDKLRKCQTVVSIKIHHVYANGTVGDSGYAPIGSNLAKAKEPIAFYDLWTSINTGRLVFTKGKLIKFYK